MALAPIGSIMTSVDSAMLGSMDRVVSAVQSAVAAPLGGALVLYVALTGGLVAYGMTASTRIVPNVIRMCVVYWLVTTAAFGSYVRDFFFTILPDFAAAAVANGTGIAATGSGVDTAAASFDALWSQAWALAGGAWEATTWYGGGSGLAMVAFISASASSLAVIVMALVFEGARLGLGVVICIGPALIAMSLFEATRGYAHRFVEACSSFVILQALVAIVLQLVLTAERAAMDKLLETAAAGGVSDRAQGLACMVGAMSVGGWLLGSLPRLSFALGNGVATHGMGAAAYVFTRGQIRSAGGAIGSGAAAVRARIADPAADIRIRRPPP